MESSQLVEIHAAMEKFLTDILQLDKDKEYLWLNFRSLLRDYENHKIILEPTLHTKKLIKRLQTVPGYKENIGDRLILSVFPSLRYQYKLDKSNKGKGNYVNPKPPIISKYKTGRKIRLSAPRLDLSNTFAAKSSQEKSARRKPVSVSSASASLFSLDFSQSCFSQAVPEEEINPILLKKDSEILDIMSQAMVDDGAKEFLYGKFNPENKYSFSLIKEPEERSDCITVSRDGVFSIAKGGNSEFQPLDEFIKGRKEYSMIKNLTLFSQFKLYKFFNLWKIMLGKSLIRKQYQVFSTTSWNAQLSFTPVLFKFRKTIMKCKDISLFPLKKLTTCEFDDIMEAFNRAIDKQSDIVLECSKVCVSLCNNFVHDIIDQYNYISTPRSIDYIKDRKLPADLLLGAKCSNKKAFSIVEEKMEKEEKTRLINRALVRVNMIKPFFKMGNLSVIETFLIATRREINNFCEYFLKSRGEVTFRVFLTYKDNELCFSPSYATFKLAFDDHIKKFIEIFNDFIVPSRIDATGNKKISKDPKEVNFIKKSLENDEVFNTEYNKFMTMIEKSYSKANFLLEQLTDCVISIYNFDAQWDTMRRNEEDTMLFIKNTTSLNQWRQKIEDMKMLQQFEMLSIDARALKNDLLEMLGRLMHDNNDILFRNFNVICEAIIKNVKSYNMTLYCEDESLKGLAEFNLHICNTISYQPELNKDIHIVNSIYNKALECGDLIPMLSIAIEKMRDAVNKLNIALEAAQNRMQKEKGRAISELQAQQKGFENKIGAFARQMRNQFTIMDVDMSASVAIGDIDATLDKIGLLKDNINEFKLIASRLNYAAFDFTQINKIETEMKQIREHWVTYQDFMTTYENLVEQTVIKCDINKLIEFINDNSEIEMKTTNHPLYIKMAKTFASLSEYLPFYTLIAKIEITPERWQDICKIIKRPYEKVKNQTIRKFCDQTVLEKIDEIRSYIIDLEQREDLVKHFNAMIDDFMGLVLKLVNSPVVKTEIISFPSMNEARRVAESFLIYLNGLSTSPFYNLIKQNCEHWSERAKQAVNILNAMLDFETNYVYLCSLTKSLFGSIHFPNEYQRISHINFWFGQFINQIKEEGHVNALVPKTEDAFLNQLDDSLLVSLEELEAAANKEEEKTASASSIVLKSMTSITGQGRKNTVSDNINEPITEPYLTQFLGDFLINCLKSANKRCLVIKDAFGYLLEEQRHAFPRLYFCSDEELVKILIACSNLRSSFDDFLPVFPSISWIHVSLTEENRVLGVTNTMNEKYMFTGEVFVTKLQVSELLKKMEIEMKSAVRVSLTDSYSTRGYTDFNKWCNKYPLQISLVCENAFFQSSIEEINASKAKLLLLKQIESITYLNEELIKNPNNSIYLSSLISLKLRHRDIISRMNKANSYDKLSIELNRIHRHSIQLLTAGELATVTFGLQTLPYGYEIISEPSVIPMTDAEEEALINYASCLTSPETFFCKQMNGNRNLAKTFADIAGIPCFNVPQQSLNSLIVAACSVRAVIILDKIDEVPSQFYNFFKCYETETKITRTDKAFHQIDINNASFLINITQEKLPEWMRERYRPIYLRNEPTTEVINNLKAIKQFTIPKVDVPLNLLGRIALRKDPNSILQTEKNNTVYVKSKQLIYFDIPEFLLTGRFIAFEDPFFMYIPDNIKNITTEIGDMIRRQDGEAARTQMNNFPMRPFTRTVKMLTSNALTIQALIFSSMKEKLFTVKKSLLSLRDGIDTMSVEWTRPIHIEIYHNLCEEAIDGAQFKEWSMKDFCNILSQERSISKYANEVLPYLENICATMENSPDYVIMNKIVTCFNIIRGIYNLDHSLTMTDLIEQVFSKNYKNLGVKEEDLYQFSLERYIPIIISGSLPSETRNYTKEFIKNNKKENDLVVYSSPFNKNLQKSVITKLRPSIEDIYRPPKDADLWICIFDYQDAVQELKDFVRALLIFRSVYSSANDAYCTVDRIHLIITTNDVDSILKLKFPVFVLERKEDKEIDWSRLESNVIFGTPKDEIQKVMQKYGNYDTINLFLDRNQDLDKTEKVIRAFSICFGEEAAKKIVHLMASTEDTIYEVQNHNFNTGVYPKDFNMASKIMETAKLDINAILVLDSMEYFRFMQNQSFVVINQNIYSSIVSALTRVSQNKTKTSFIIDMNCTNKNDAFDFIFFFLFNAKEPKYSTVFEYADFQLFKYYIDNDSTVEKTFEELCTYINFIFVCNEENIKEIPEIIRSTLPVIKPNYKLNNSQKYTSFPYKSVIQEYVNLSEAEYEEKAKYLRKILNEHSSDIMSEMQFILQFYQNLISLEPKLTAEEDTNIDMATSDNITKRIEQLSMKVEDARQKKQMIDETREEKTDRLRAIEDQIENEIEIDIRTIQETLGSLSYEDQTQQINEWLSNSDEYYSLVNIYKDIFGFLATSNFFEQAEDGNCKLVAKVISLKIDDIESIISEKMKKFNIENDSTLSGILEQSNMGKDTVSDVALINSMIGMMSIISESIKLKDERNTLSGEIAKLNSRGKANAAYLDQLLSQYEEFDRVMKKKSGTIECPQWILKAWLANQAEVKNLLEIVKKCTATVQDVVGNVAEAEQLIKGYIANTVGYQHGLASLSYEERKKILKETKADVFRDPFKLLEKIFIVQMFFPVSSMMSLFTQSLAADDDTQDTTTFQPFNTISVIDQVLFNHLIPLKPLFFTDKETNNGILTLNPLPIFYDPQNIAMQVLISTYKDLVLMFTSESFDIFANSVSNGATLIVQVDSVESGHKFFNQFRHAQLQIGATSCIYLKDQKKPVSTNFKLFVVTSIPAKEFSFKKNEVVFADFSVDKPQETEWFKLATIFSVNKTIYEKTLKYLRNLTSKTENFFKLLKKISELSHNSWPEYFENSTKMMLLKTTLEHFVKAVEGINKSKNKLRNVLSPDSDEKYAVSHFKDFTSLCKKVVSECNEPYAAFHFLNTLAEFKKTHITDNNVNQSSLLRNFELILLKFTSCLQQKDRIKFISNFECKYLKGVFKVTDLLLESDFPNLSKMQVDPLLTQVITHINQVYNEVPSSYFTFMSEQIMPRLKDNPIVFFIDPLIPLDYAARFISDTLQEKFIVISGFTISHKTESKHIEHLIAACKKNGEKLIIIFDSFIPTFVVPSIIYYSHIHSYTSYYIVTYSQLSRSLGIVPNALVYTFDRPHTISCCVSLMRTLPMNFTNVLENEGSLLYLFLILLHREDFFLSISHIAPLVKNIRPLWQSEGGFSNKRLRKLWGYLFKVMAVSYTGDPMLQITIGNVVDYFFQNDEPSIPGIDHVDFANKATYLSDVPPTLLNTGRMVPYSPCMNSEHQGWRSKLPKNAFFSTMPPKNKKMDCVIIKGAEIVNAFWKNDELAIAGQSKIDIYVYKEEVSNTSLKTVKGGVYDGEEFISLISLPCSGSKDVWALSNIHIQLPKLQM